MIEPGERLNKFLALHAGTSRRVADELIAAGRVTIDGSVAQLGARLPENAAVSVDGHTITPHTEYAYVALYKPSGYICSRKKQGETDTIYSLLPEQYHHLNPVGRLDKDTSGLLLLSNDGEFAFQMTHPKFRKTKVYETLLDKPLEPLHQQMIADFGVTLEDGKSRLGMERLSEDRKRWQITMQEGRNRQIRRTFSSLGYTVMQLHRTQFGPYQLAGLKPKEIRVIPPAEKK